MLAGKKNISDASLKKVNTNLRAFRFLLDLRCSAHVTHYTFTLVTFFQRFVVIRYTPFLCKVPPLLSGYVVYVHITYPFWFLLKP